MKKVLAYIFLLLTTTYTSVEAQNLKKNFDANKKLSERCDMKFDKDIYDDHHHCVNDNVVFQVWAIDGTYREGEIGKATLIRRGVTKMTQFSIEENALVEYWCLNYCSNADDVDRRIRGYYRAQ